MKKSLMIGLFTICSIAILGHAMHSAAPPTQPGMAPYNPTRPAWLTLDLEASYREDFGRDSVYSPLWRSLSNALKTYSKGARFL